MIIECNVKSFYAFIDKEACTKILSNLLSNAIKYARSKIIVRFEAQDGERFTIDIMNDGKPISEEIKEKIFEPFYRDDSSIHKSGTARTTLGPFFSGDARGIVDVGGISGRAYHL